MKFQRNCTENERGVVEVYLFGVVVFCILNWRDSNVSSHSQVVQHVAHFRAILVEVFGGSFTGWILKKFLSGAATNGNLIGVVVENSD